MFSELAFVGGLLTSVLVVTISVLSIWIDWDFPFERDGQKWEVVITSGWIGVDNRPEVVGQRQWLILKSAPIVQPIFSCPATNDALVTIPSPQLNDRTGASDEVATEVFALLKTSPTTSEIFSVPVVRPTSGFTANSILPLDNFLLPTQITSSMPVTQQNLAFSWTSFMSAPTSLVTPSISHSIPLQVFTLIFLIVPAFQIRRMAIRKHRVRAGHCTSCGYDLRGSAGRCPECGTTSR
jgi:hypothetical protein